MKTAVARGLFRFLLAGVDNRSVQLVTDIEVKTFDMVAELAITEDIGQRFSDLCLHDCVRDVSISQK